MFHKRVLSPFVVTTSVKFCISNTLNGARYGASDSINGIPHSYSIVQCNLFKSGSVSIDFSSGRLGDNGANNAGEHWWTNNVFYQSGVGLTSPVQFSQAYDATMFNNIYFESRRMWREFTDSTAYGDVIKYANYDVDFGTTLTSDRYEYRDVIYSTSALLQANRADLTGNNTLTNPLFTAPLSNDFTLQAGSPALSGGVDGTQQGLYLGNFYTVGAS